MIEPQHDLSVRRQCELLKLARSGVYRPLPTVEEDLTLCKELDELHLEFPALGSRKLSRLLKAQGKLVNRKRVQRLMRIMGIEALAPKPRTSEAAPEHTRFPYLLRHLDIVRPNQVWASDITYIPTRQGHCYLVAVMDWYTRRVLSWRISNTMDSRFCIDAVEDAVAKFGLPQIFNTDQGAQFTDGAFTSPLLDKGVKVSMDGRGRFMDNIFVERLWRSVKCEEVYLNDYRDVADAHAGIGTYLDKYNRKRPHQTLGFQTPEAFYEFEMEKLALKAA
jgi:putative transposase